MLRITTVTQSLRLFVPLFIKQNSDTLNDKKKICFSLTPILENINGMFEKHDCDPLTLNEVQVAVDSVLVASKCPIIDWNGQPYVNVSIEDAKRIVNYISSIQPLSSEKHSLGITDVDDSYFADIL